MTDRLELCTAFLPVSYTHLDVYKRQFKGFLAMTKEATSTVGSIMVMIVCCLMLSRVFTVYRVPELVLELLMSIDVYKRQVHCFRNPGIQAA